MKYMKQGSPNNSEEHSSESVPPPPQFTSNNQQIFNNGLSNVHQQSSNGSNQNMQPEINSLPNPNICCNKICKLYVKTPVNIAKENNPQNLCPDCLIQYQKESYCLYCKQIYFDFTDDGKEWIQCDECERWVHTECSDFFPASSNAIFNCIKCKKIDVGVSAGRRVGGARGNAGKGNQRRKPQQCMLNAFGFYWQLGGAQLAQDIQKLKMYLK